MTWRTKAKQKENQPPELFVSSLYNEDTFYDQFITDLRNATEQVIIESPYITVKRLHSLLQVFTHLKSKNVSIFIITRSPQEHDNTMAIQSERGIQWFEKMGIQVLLENGGHHRKLAIIDREILWEGSLNILSQTKSREIMRRILDKQLVLQMLNFLNYNFL